MKNIYFYLLLMTSTLIARDNPFIATDAYNEEVARLMEINDDYPLDRNKEDMNKYEDMNSTLDIPKTSKNKIINKYEDMSGSMKSKKKLEKVSPKKIKTKKVQKEVKKIKKKVHKKIIMKKEEIIYVKKRKDIPSITKEYNPLDFLSFTYSDDIIEISSSKYKIFKKFTIDNKIILDFRANDAHFYTKRKNLDTYSFNKLTIGNHRNESFFRVVITLNDKPSAFKVTHSEDLVSISRK